MDPSMYTVYPPPSRQEEEKEEENEGHYRPHQYIPPLAPAQQGFHHRPNEFPPPFNPYNGPAQYDQWTTEFHADNQNNKDPPLPFYNPAPGTFTGGYSTAPGNYALASSGFDPGLSKYGHSPVGFYPGLSGYDPASDGFDTTTGSFQASSSSFGKASGSLELPDGQLVRISCKANPAFNLAVERHGGVIMVPANLEDEAQLWIKDLSYGFRVKDNYGHPAFTLVNKKTRKLLKHAKEKGQQVLLMDYRPEIRDDDILWSESEDFGDGFKTFRSASDTLLNLTVFEGKKSIRNGSALVLDTWHKGDHQLWKIFPLW